MDKLINYINYREKKYGYIETAVSATSIYYRIGTINVRVSDHMKYNDSELQKQDYYFIPQVNDLYIFITNPKLNPDGKLYMKIVSYQDAKNFIKNLHDFSIKQMKMMDWFKFESGVLEDPSERSNEIERLDWDTFKKKYICGKDVRALQRVCDCMDITVYGHLRQGSTSKKIEKLEEIYNNMSQNQYKEYMKKMEK